MFSKECNGLTSATLKGTGLTPLCIKWFYRSYREDGTLAVSFGCKTKAEAESWMTR